MKVYALAVHTFAVSFTYTMSSQFEIKNALILTDYFTYIHVCVRILHLFLVSVIGILLVIIVILIFGCLYARHHSRTNKSVNFKGICITIEVNVYEPCVQTSTCKCLIYSVQVHSEHKQGSVYYTTLF